MDATRCGINLFEQILDESHEVSLGPMIGNHDGAPSRKVEPTCGGRLEHRVSEVIGFMPQIAPKKHVVLSLWQSGMRRCGRPM